MAVLLLLEVTPLASSSSLIKAELRQVCGPAILFGSIGFTKSIYQILVILSNGLADLLSLKLLEL